MKRIVGRIFLSIIGWKQTGGKPPYDKYVLVTAPHTSNWDLVIMLALSWVYGIKIHWMGKKQIFRWPWAWLMRLLGGIAVDRSARRDMVQQMADIFARADKLTLGVPAEGTRSRAEYWKSGFYYIAQAANVPIVLGVLDYKKKEGGFGPALRPTGDLKSDMDRIRAYYADKTAKFPEKFGPVRLRDEERDASTSAA